jgi:hypothetical protein
MKDNPYQYSCGDFMFAQELELIHESVEKSGSYGSVMKAIDSEWINSHTFVLTRRVFVIVACLHSRKSG